MFIYWQLSTTCITGFICTYMYMYIYNACTFYMASTLSCVHVIILYGIHTSHVHLKPLPTHSRTCTYMYLHVFSHELDGLLDYQIWDTLVHGRILEYSTPTPYIRDNKVKV